MLAIIFEGGSEEDAASLEQGQGASGEAETLGEKAEIKRWAETMITYIFLRENST